MPHSGERPTLLLYHGARPKLQVRLQPEHSQATGSFPHSSQVFPPGSLPLFFLFSCLERLPLIPCHLPHLTFHSDIL